MTSWTVPSLRWSAAVSFNAAAACSTASPLFQRIAAQPSGLITLYHAYCIMATRSATAMPNAPPDPPSPTMTDTIGTRSRDISIRLTAMAWAWPRSSAPIPG